MQRTAVVLAFALVALFAALAAAQAPLSVVCTQPESVTGKAKCFELDDFSLASKTNQFIRIDGPSGPTSLSSTACINTGAIMGGVREIKIENFAAIEQCSISARVGVFTTNSPTGSPTGFFTFSRDSGCEVPSRATLRLDGEGNCGQNSFSDSFKLISSSGGVALASLGNAFELSAASDFEIDIAINVYGSTAADKASKTLRVPANSVIKDYYVPFTQFNSQTPFSSTAGGAIEIVIDGSSSLNPTDTTVFYFDIVQPVVEKGSITGRIFDDCGCNGQSGATDLGAANVQVSLTGSSGCSVTSLTATTNSLGDFSFTDLPGTCTYTVSVSGLTLCSNSGNTPTRSGLQIGSVANFAVLVSAGSLVIPNDVSVGCGDDTSIAAVGTGRCSDTCSNAGQGTVTSVDTVVSSTCTAPGGVLTTISRAWTGCGATLTQVIRITDRSLAPTFDNFPADATVDCNAPLPSPSVTATGRCTTATVTHADVNGQQTCSTSCSLTTTVTRTYTAVDACGNSASRPQLITRTACAGECPECPTCPDGPVVTDSPSSSEIFTGRANCVLICDDDESAASTVVASAVMALVLAVVALCF